MNLFIKGNRRSDIQRLYDELKENALKLWEYSIHLDMLQERNSCSKTDPDATFMHVKYDYYNHTNVFKPGYNIQIGVSDGIIRNVYISSDGNDMKTYIPFMEKYKEAYGELPTKTPADAGYGSYDNYSYCKENNIELYMKYSGYYKEKEKTTKKNQRLINRHCQGCSMKSQCTKSKTGRIITYCKELYEFHEEVKKNVESEEGIQLMFQRSNETEGMFGDLKQNQKYDRLHRRGETGVRLEIYLVCIGHNIRKYHRIKIKAEKKVKEMLSLLS